MSLDVDVRASAEMSTALQSINNMTSDMDDMENNVDPDAQGNLTDFLDFTEYLPSDMIRSLTLVRSLNQLSMDSSNALHDLTKRYGMLPNPLSHIHQNAKQLRVDISEDVDEAVNSRLLSVNEAARMTENVDRHYKRAQHILEKLRSMAETYPPSREASPSFQLNVSPRVARTPKITLRLDGGRSAANNSILRIPKHRAPRITVPGEVLAPYDIEFENYATETEDIESEEEHDIPRHTLARRTPGPGGKKIKVSKVTKIKGPKPPRAPRPPGVMGTNVHSAVAGISTSNALAKLKPPPDDAVPGSADAPWLQLTAWELAKLRKRMKKNAVWNPSDTMIARELKQLGRGIEAYRKAKMHADESGQPFEQTQAISADDGEGNQITVEGAISADALAKEDVQLSNRGMKLNEAKKLKRETQAKELAQAAAEVDAATNKLKGLFAKTANETTSAAPTATSKEAPAKTPSRRKPAKRKREDSIVDIDTPKNEAEVPSPSTNANKKMKLETPVPAPLAPPAPSVPSIPSVPSVPSVPSAPSVPPVQQASAAPAAPTLPSLPNMSKTSPEILPASDSSNSSVATVTTTTTVPLRSSPSKKSSTPILPPTKGKKDLKKDINPTTVVTPAQERQASKAPTPTPPPPSTTLLASRRPPSRSKAASAEPTSSIGKDRPRRPSTVHNTPAPEQTPSRARTPSRPSSRRGKRPAPGPITAGSEGSTAVSVGKRKAAPRKKPGSKKQLKAEEKELPQVWDEFDDEGVIIDPNEPRYCLCNRVSFGVMICCENKDCEKEWFHLECVGLTDVPPRTTKWYCPDCRVTLRIGEKGEVTARGKKK